MFGNDSSALTSAKPRMWVKETLPPRVRLRWLLMTMRVSNISLAGTARTLVAVGTVREADMFLATAAEAPRSTLDSSVGSSAVLPESDADLAALPVLVVVSEPDPGPGALRGGVAAGVDRGLGARLRGGGLGGRGGLGVRSRDAWEPLPLAAWEPLPLAAWEPLPLAAWEPLPLAVWEPLLLGALPFDELRPSPPPDPPVALPSLAPAVAEGVSLRSSPPPFLLTGAASGSPPSGE